MSDNTPNSIPNHVAIIPDGNRRWAKGKGVTTLQGHQKGVEAMRWIAESIFDRGVKYMTLYLFSTENWNRPRGEVRYLMKLFYKVATIEVQKLHKRGIRVLFLGSREGLDPALVKVMEDGETLTAENQGGTLSLCLNYGGQPELAEAFSAMLADDIKPNQVTPELITKYMYAPDLPPVDFIIRASGEERTSGFMMWRAAYAELYFTEVLWPDFKAADLDKALGEYASRQRRFGH